MRAGFSTGTAATAGAKAALEMLLTGNIPDRIQVTLPQGGQLTIPIQSAARISAFTAEASVIKDGGDDPDSTHGAFITTTVALDPEADEERIVFSAGPGVGQVTRPGLPVPVGEPAINPTPREMIIKGLRQAWAVSGQSGRALAAEVTVAVADGEKLARHTLNPRLGIMGGLSILGTTGLVKPYSHEAYTSTIESGLSVAQALGLREVVLTTGGKSEKQAMKMRPDLPEPAFIQIADYYGFALGEVKRRGFARLGLVSFFGKAVKQARDLDNTHARVSPMDLASLAGWLTEAGADKDLADEITLANTARHALEILRAHNSMSLVAEVGRRMTACVTRRSREDTAVWVRIIDFDNTILYSSSEDGGKA